MGLPLALAGIQAGLGVVQGISGLINANRSRKTLEQLVKERPYTGVPSAFQKYANEPISAQLRKEQELIQSRNLGTSVGAIGKGDSRGVGALAGLNQGAEDATRRRFSEYEQARIDALRTLGGAQENAMQRNTDAWRIMMQGAQQQLAEGRQMAFGGLGEIARGAAYGIEDLLKDKV